MKVFRENWINAFYCTDCITVLLYCVPPTGGFYSSILFTLGHLRPRREIATSCNLSWCSHQYQQDTATTIKKERAGTPLLPPKFLLVFWVFKHFSPWLYTPLNQRDSNYLLASPNFSLYLVQTSCCRGQLWWKSYHQYSMHTASKHPAGMSQWSRTIF